MKPFPVFSKRFAAVVGIMAVAAGAQAFTHADSGWIRIFNGQDYTGLYSRLWGSSAQITTPPNSSIFQLMYLGTDTAAIVVNPTTGGNIGTLKTSYSHYRARVEQKFGRINSTDNGGLTYHTDESAIRMQNNWPRSIEFQMQQQYSGAAYSIQQVTFTTRATGTAAGSNYSATGANVVNACEFGCNGRWYRGNPLISNAGPNGQPRWLRFELVVRGSDSAIHIINDTVVMRLWNIRIFHDSTQTTSNRTPNQPWTHGALGLQSEGAVISYRRWEIMEFPASTPMSEHFLHRLVLDNPRQPVKPAGGGAVSIQWRSIGTIPKVKIEYRVGAAGAWQTITDSTGNTGSYGWTAPAQVPDSLRFRISSYDYVTPDSTGSSGLPTRIFSSRNPQPVFFTLNGRGLTLTGTGGFSRAEISDATGKVIRSLSVRGESLHWDLSGGGGRVPAGLYFIRLEGAGSTRTVRIPVL